MTTASLKPYGHCSIIIGALSFLPAATSPNPNDKLIVRIKIIIAVAFCLKGILCHKNESENSKFLFDIVYNS